MNPQEKAAWYTLGVIMMAVVSYCVLLSLTGRHVVAMSGFVLIVLLVFSGLFGVRSKVGLAGGERDPLIALKAQTISLNVFMVYFSLYCLLPLFIGDYGSSDPIIISEIRSTVPSHLLIFLLLTGTCVIKGTHALTTLVLYRADAVEHQTMVDRYRNMSRMRRTGLWVIAVGMLVITPLMIAMLEVGKGELSQLFGYLVCGGLAVVYVLTRYYLGIGVITDEAMSVLAIVRKRGDRGLATQMLAVTSALGFIWLLPLEIELVSKMPQSILIGLMGGWLALGGSAFFAGKDFISSQSAKEQPDA